MSKKPLTTKAEADPAVKDILRETAKVHSEEDKIRIVPAGPVERTVSQACAAVL
jgi:hypothetical protein